MIYGKSYEQRRRERHERLKKEMEYRPVFAWWPVELEDGKKVWLEWVYKRHDHNYDYHMIYIHESDDVTYSRIPK